MRLSVENINSTAPYWVIQLDELTFRFITKNGVSYRVGFYKDTYFLGDKAYHFFISKEDELLAPKDFDTYKTVTCILEEFFRHDKSVMLYICDPRDHRESIRANLYKRWFASYHGEAELTLQDEEIHFENCVIYTGMIIRNDHPDYNQLLNMYADFVKRAESLYQVDPK